MNKKIVIHIGKSPQKLSTSIHRQFTSNLNRMWKKIKDSLQRCEDTFIFCFFYINAYVGGFNFLIIISRLLFNVSSVSSILLILSCPWITVVWSRFSGENNRYIFGKGTYISDEDSQFPYFSS